jgi:hypothetical protein
MPPSLHTSISLYFASRFRARIVSMASYVEAKLGRRIVSLTHLSRSLMVLRSHCKISLSLLSVISQSSPNTPKCRMASALQLLERLSPSSPVSSIVSKLQHCRRAVPARSHRSSFILTCNRVARLKSITGRFARKSGARRIIQY